MKIVTLDSVSGLASYPRTHVLLKFSDKEGFEHHCDAIVLADQSGVFRLLCASACPLGLGRTYCLRREGHEHPCEVSMKEESLVKIEGDSQIFGYVHLGQFL